jgi:hypothetical protein
VTAINHGGNGSQVEANFEANSNVCCHGRGMLQWEARKTDTQAPRTGDGASAGSWRIDGRRRGSGLIRRQ